LRTSRLIHYTNSDITGTSVVLSEFEVATEYYWHVKGYNANQESPWSEYSSFLTVLEPPILTSPLDGVTELTTSPELNWEEVRGAEAYDVEVSDDGFASSILTVEDVVSTSAVVNGLDNFTSYQWRVQAKTDQTASEYSDIWGFRTELAKPDLVYPEHDATGLPQDFTFDWNEVNGAESYDFQLAESESFSLPIIDLTNLTVTKL
jgi:hypothetical protein